MNSITEHYGEYIIEKNSVPENKSNFANFGWAFQVFKDGSLCFRMVIKSIGIDNSESDRSYVCNWCKAKIHSMIDDHSFKKGNDYCYTWEGTINYPIIKKIDCNEFLTQS